MLPLLVRCLAAVAAVAVFAVSPQAFAQAQRWSTLTPTGFVQGHLARPAHFAATDASGNLFVAGHVTSPGSFCFVTLKYTADGALGWRRDICSPYPETSATAVAVDRDGNVYVTGTVAVCCQVNFDRPAEIRTVKYRGSDGAVLWDRSWSAGTNSVNAAYAVVLDPSGYPYVVGTSYTGSSYRLKVIKYNPANGEISWESVYDGGGNYSIIGAGVAPNGDLLVGTQILTTSGGHPEIFDFSGTGGYAIWRYTGGIDETLAAFTVDSTGAAITAMRSFNPATQVDGIRLRKHGTMGTTVWLREYGSAGDDFPYAVASDAAGNIVVAADLGGIYDLLRYTRDGQLLFESTYSTEGRPARATAVAFDPEGNILSAGQETTAQGQFMRVAKQDSTLGTVRWQARIGPGGSTQNGGAAVIAYVQGVYAIGVEAVLGAATPSLRIVNFSNAASGTNVNVHGLWWNEAQSGWGINLVQQGDKLFATWYLYDQDGQGMWLVMSDGVPSGTNSWSGQVHRTTGPAFYNFNSSSASQVSYALVGTATLTFIDGNHGTMTTTVNGVARSNNITRFQFGAMPTCSLGASAPATPNYTDIWWRPGESGWGISLAHQGDIVFALWYTYSADARGMWLVASKLDRVGDRLYSGALYRTTGTPYAASTWQLPQYQPMGSLTLNFTDANNAVMDYTVGGITQSKTITRYVFASPVTVCR